LQAKGISKKNKRSEEERKPSNQVYNTEVASTVTAAGESREASEIVSTGWWCNYLRQGRSFTNERTEQCSSRKRTGEGRKWPDENGESIFER